MLQEARALWPDTPIDCVVSLGAGAVPVVRRPKSMSSYLDTGNVLIESACSIERVDESLATLAPMIPGLKYFRFNPVDDANNMELDCIDQAEHDKVNRSLPTTPPPFSGAAFDPCASPLPLGCPAS